MKVQLYLVMLTTALSCQENPHPLPEDKAAPGSAEFQKAENLFFAGKNPDSAFYYLSRVTGTSKDSLEIAIAFDYMSVIQEDAGDHFGSQESALEGLKHLNENNPAHYYCLSSIYNELGLSNKELKNYAAAIEYYNLAKKFQQTEAYKIVLENNKALVYRDQHEYRKAISILQSNINRQRGDTLQYARTKSNLANIRWLAEPKYNPAPELLDALALRIKAKSDIGVTASYNHLSDYYLSRNHDSALRYAAEMYRLALGEGLVDEQLLALRKLVVLVAAEDSRTYFKKYVHLNDSVTNARNNAKNQFALIRYRSEKNKMENLQLQQDNTQKKLQIFRQRAWIIGIASLIALAAIVTVLGWRKKKQQIEWKAQSAIHNNRLKTSQKVHDVVANGLYRIINELEHRKEIDKEILLDRMEHLYEQSRDISYETDANYVGNPREKIDVLLNGFANADTIVSVAGNEDHLWERVPPQVVAELDHVLQELMINMSKHSKAKYVTIRFSIAENVLEISYRDDGTGFSSDFQKGNGLNSTENRITGIGGQLIFTNEKTKGASILMVIPLPNS